MAVDYSSFLSDVSKSRVPNPIRGLLHLETFPNVISLLAGKPNPATFPITSISFNARNPLKDGKEESFNLTQEEVAVALQYNMIAGVPELVAWLADFQAHEHKRAKDSAVWRLSVGAGGQDMIYKAFLTLINHGDSVLVEAPVYAGVIPLLQTLQAKPVEVETDPDGVDPNSLREILESWPVGKPMPKVMYTVPYGNNPSGSTTTEARRREILALAHKYNFLIIEDCPYYFLYFDSKPRPPSYFSLDTEGRVLRIDSFSKVLAAGLRICFATGPTPLLVAIDLHTSSANLQAASTSQVIVYKLLSSWGIEGLHAHIRTVADFYLGKRDVFQAAMERHLTGLARWSLPRAGMFFWFELVLPPGGDSKELIQTKAFEAGVLALPGVVFYANASFSLLDEAEVIRNEWPDGHVPAATS
ncbi:TdiD protein [Auriculariales sp. MPI-PUGE-AT-0066]|nr:TdiD protein [Auriculariales sp. MPI-PUGE-AT-0066]